MRPLKLWHNGPVWDPGSEPDDTPRSDAPSVFGDLVPSGAGWIGRNGVAHLHVPPSAVAECGEQAGIILVHTTLPGPRVCPLCQAIATRRAQLA